MYTVFVVVSSFFVVVTYTAKKYRKGLVNNQCSMLLVD